MVLGNTVLDKSHFRDDYFTLYDGSDRSKKSQFQLSSISSGNTRVLSIPDQDGEILLVDGGILSVADLTLTGTLTANILTDGTQSLTAGAFTADIMPDNDGTLQVGTDTKKFLSGNFSLLVGIDTMTISGGRIFDTSGQITLDTNNFITTGTLGAGAITGTSLITGGNIGIAADLDLLQLAADLLTVNGKVGIGGAPTTHPLHIFQSAHTTGILINGFDTQSAETGSISINTSGNMASTSSKRMVYTAATDIFFRGGASSNTINFADNTDADVLLVHGGGNVIMGDGTNKTVISATGDITQAGTAITTLDQLYLNEITTPTAVPDDGAIYTKNNNELFFQSGDGVEHLLHGDAFSEIWFNGTGTVEVTISTQNAFTKIDSFAAIGHEDDLLNVVGNISTNTLTLSSIASGEYEVSYHGSVTATGGADKLMRFNVGITLATPKDITNVTDNLVSPIVITSVAHGLDNGEMVEIVNVVGNTAANGSFIVDSKADDTFVIVALDGSATTGNGDYNEGSPTGDITIEYPGSMAIKRAVRGADLGAVSATGLHILVSGDVLSLYVANLSGTTNLTLATVSLDAFRIGD